MRTAIDTNVISALWSGEPIAARMSHLLSQYQSEGGLVIAPPVFAELLAHPGTTTEFVESFLTKTGIMVEFTLEEPIWRRAAEAFRDYAIRRRASGGREPKRLLADFVIGAHAQLRADRLLSLDPQRYRLDFPNLQLES